MTTQPSLGPRCPTCDMQVHWRPAESTEAAKYLPFCSERCKLIDLGRWLNEEHAVTCDSEEDEDEARSALPSEIIDRRPAPKLPPGWHDA